MPTPFQQDDSGSAPFDPLRSHHLHRVHHFPGLLPLQNLRLPHGPTGIFDQLYRGFTEPSAFPVNMALMDMLKDSHEHAHCPEHPSKPLDYYCLKCFCLICADCFIFGKHQEHKLSKKKELKDLNSYLISTLDNLYKKNEGFEEIKGFEEVEDYLAAKIEDRLARMQSQIDSSLMVGRRLL